MPEGRILRPQRLGQRQVQLQRRPRVSSSPPWHPYPSPDQPCKELCPSFWRSREREGEGEDGADFIGSGRRGVSGIRWGRDESDAWRWVQKPEELGGKRQAVGPPPGACTSISTFASLTMTTTTTRHGRIRSSSIGQCDSGRNVEYYSLRRRGRRLCNVPRRTSDALSLYCARLLLESRHVIIVDAACVLETEICVITFNHCGISRIFFPLNEVRHFFALLRASNLPSSVIILWQVIHLGLSRNNDGLVWESGVGDGWQGTAVKSTLILGSWDRLTYFAIEYCE